MRYTNLNMKKSILTSLTFLALPLYAFAAATSTSLQGFLSTIPAFLSGVIIPFFFGIAFLIFVINIIRFFVIEGNNEDGRKKAKALAIYSVSAFVFLIILWGIINLLAGSSGLSGQSAPCMDYMKVFGTCP